jgi:hypothetical protein
MFVKRKEPVLPVKGYGPYVFSHTPSQKNKFFLINVTGFLRFFVGKLFMGYSLAIGCHYRITAE